MEEFLAGLELSWGVITIALATVIGWAIQGFIGHRFRSRLVSQSQTQQARDSLIGQQIQLSPSVVERRIQGIAELWNSFCRCKGQPPSAIVSATDLLTSEEYEKVIVRRQFIEALNAELSETQLFEWLKQENIEMHRPFIEERSYRLWFMYRAVIARRAFLVLESVQKQEARHWFEDRHTQRLMEEYLTTQEIEELARNRIGRQRRFTEVVEKKLLKSLKSTQAGSTEQDFQQVDEILTNAEILRSRIHEFGQLNSDASRADRTR